MQVLYHHRTQGRRVEAVHISGVCSGLEKLGYQIEIVGPPGVKVDPDVSAPVVENKKGFSWGRVAKTTPQFAFELLEIGYNLFAVPRLLLRCRRLKPDFIYERYALYSAAGMIASKLTGIPLILEINDVVNVDRERHGKQLTMPKVARFFERKIFKGSTGIVAVSGHLRDQTVALGIPARKVQVTPNAINPERFNPQRVDGESVRAKHNLNGKFVLGFVGSFAKWHGTELLLRAAHRLSYEFPNLAVLLVGDGNHREAMEKAATQLGILNRVVFAGPQPHSEIPAHMAAMDIAVVPGANEFVSPVKVFEYMAMARPTVAARYKPLEDAIEHGKDGLLFDPHNTDALVNALRIVLANEPLRKKLGTAARATILEKHLWVHNAQAAVNLWRKQIHSSIRTVVAQTEGSRA